MNKSPTPPPLIEALKPYKDSLNFKYLVSLPNHTPYGNLTLTYMEMVIRIECLNELIKELYNNYDSLQATALANNGDVGELQPFKHKFQTEQVIYWLRKTADEAISIIYVLKYYKEHEGTFPTQILIASIGTLLGSKEELDETLAKHFELLGIINEISNGFKHTLINAQVHNRHGRDEPVVFALYAYNKSTSVPSFHQISLRAILMSYNEFLLDVKAILSTKYQKIA